MRKPLYTKYGNPSTDNYVEVEEGTQTMFSYNTRIASKAPDGTVTLFPAWNYSQTTNYYRGQFLGEGVAETRKRIESGEYKMA